MRKPTLRLLFGAAILSSTLLAACEDYGTNRMADGATVSLLLTDAPGDVLAAVVTIEEIYLQGGEGGRTVLLSEPVTVNLLDLVGETMTLLEGIEVEPGEYGQMRFVISGGYLEVEGDAGSRFFASAPDYAGLPEDTDVEGELKMPSFDSSGLKVNFQGALIIEEGENTFLVDFDVAGSFGKEAGQSGKWVMHPVLLGTKVVEEEAGA